MDFSGRDHYSSEVATVPSGLAAVEHDSDVDAVSLQHVAPRSSPSPQLDPSQMSGAAPSVVALNSHLDLERAYREHAAPLLARLRKAFGAGPPDPDEIVQQAFERLLERGGIEGINNLRAFLWRTARNLTLNKLSAADVRTRYDYEVEQLYFPLRGDSHDPETVLSVRQELRVINETLRQMPERRRRAFLLHRVEGLSVREVARRLRIGSSPAHRHIERAAADIHVALSEKHEQDDQ
ncbi:MAG: RNA polymerase sigma factor [Pseudomonadota bacterium]